MNLIIFDEVAISKNVLKNGFTDSQFNWKEALLAAKQMVSFGYGEQKTKKALISFCEKNDPFFNYVRNRKVLGKIVKRAISGEMRMTGEVTIYRSEIDKISTIRNFRKQKIALCSLLIAKRRTNSGYVNSSDWKIIKEMVSRKISNREIQETFSEMYSLEMLVPVGASQKIVFMSATPELEDVVFQIKTDEDARSVSKKYKDIKGGEVGFCSRCEKEFIKKNPRQVLCPECSRISRLEKYKRYNAKRVKNG